MDDQPTVNAPTLVAAMWRKSLAADLTKMLSYVARGDGLIGPPVIDGKETECTNPYGMVLALIGPDGVVVSTHGLQYQEDFDRTLSAIRDTFDPESATSRVQWEREQQAKIDAYNAKPFACERGLYCQDRFDTARGRAIHYRARRHRHDGQRPPPPITPRPTLAAVEDWPV